METTIFQFKITLKWSKPSIWRRILVRSSSTFKEFSMVILCAMGWEDYHLHSFRVINPITREKVDIYPRGPCGGLPFGRGEVLEDTNILSSYFSMDNPKGSYLYDFGDNWEHVIVLEKIFDEDSTQNYPQCIAGKRACPPEDCGGICGYQMILEGLADPENPEYQDHLEWLSFHGEYDPTHFNPREVRFLTREERN